MDKILIWGKTSPELSTKYVETVCTAGVREDGCPVRLYPIPFRYLDSTFKRYQWITVELIKSESDPRPESYKVREDSIRLGDVVPTSQDEWGIRREWIFKNLSWQFESVEQLSAAQKANRTSLALLKPKSIDGVDIVERSEEEARNWQEKLERLRKDTEIKKSQLTLFEQTLPPEVKNCAFQTHRISLRWTCFGSQCRGHHMQILDWEVAELQRREGVEAAKSKVEQLSDLDAYDLWLYLGNLFLHPTSFLIVGLWYPKRKDLLFR